MPSGCSIGAKGICVAGDAYSNPFVEVSDERRTIKHTAQLNSLASNLKLT